MYHYHYGVFKKLYKDNGRLLMTDTDSLFYEIKTNDVYENLFGKDSKFKELFDTSNFKIINPYYSTTNKKVNGKLKGENGDNIIDKFAGLKSKNYAFSYASQFHQYLNNGDKSKLVRCKGTIRTTLKDNITLDSIVNTLKYSSLTKHDNYCISSKNIN